MRPPGGVNFTALFKQIEEHLEDTLLVVVQEKLLGPGAVHLLPPLVGVDLLEPACRLENLRQVPALKLYR